jgi:hypothetical protein
MFSKEFIEEYSLFRKFPIEHDLGNNVEHWYTTPINMKCHTCQSMETFNMTNGFEHDGYNGYNIRPANRVFDLRYECQSCKSFERRFFIYVNEKVDKMYKVGQHPEWEIKMDKRLEKILGSHSKTYKNGLVCESQGYGIGAFSYYRRITEEIIDKLLNSLTDLLEPSQIERYNVALEKTKKTTVTSDKIDLVKDLLPQSLRPSGMNPLSILHSELSKGLHGQSDESCLESAGNIKKILIYLVKRISENQEDSAEFTEGMKAFLDKKSGN